MDRANRTRLPLTAPAPEADPLIVVLRMCGLEGHDVLGWSDRLEQSLAFADLITP